MQHKNVTFARLFTNNLKEMHKIIQTFIHEAPLQRLPDPVAHRHEHLLVHCSLQQKKGICSTHVYTKMLDEWLMKKDKLRFHPFYVRFSRSSSTFCYVSTSHRFLFPIPIYIMK